MFAKRAMFTSLIVALAGTASATPPAAPQVTFGPAGVKQLRFDWNYVPMANYYEVWFKANDGAAPAKFGERPSWNPHWVTGISAHLLDWQQARWEIKACNPSGCTSSGLIDVGTGTLANAVGFFKPPLPTGGMKFGQVIAMSEDGNTIAATCPDKVYVFRRTNGEWRQEASFVMSPTATDNDVKMRLSADGNLLAIGMFADYWDTAASTTPRGSVSLFRRTGTSWKREARFTEAGTFRLGQNLDLDESGNTLAFSVEVSGLGGLRLEIYKHAAAGWTRAAQLDETVHRCVGYALSGDGSTFVRRCVVNGQIRIETFAAPGWTPRDSFVQTPPDPTYGPSMLATDYTGDIIVSSLMQAGLTPASAWNPETDVFRRNAGVYERVAALHPSRYAGKDLRFRNYFGAGLDVSHAGSYIAVVDPDDTLGGLVTSQPTAADANKPQHGAVYVFEKRGTGYALRRHVNLPSQPTWGFNITTQAALALDGKTLVISEPTNFSGSAGIQGDRDDTSAPVSGAFWLF